MLPSRYWVYHQVYRAWLLLLFSLLALSGCQTRVGTSFWEIQPLTFPQLLNPDHSYTFSFQVRDSTSKQPQAAAVVEALLRLDDGTVLQLFKGQADPQGRVTFTYQTPYRQPAGVASLTLQAQGTGQGSFQGQLELLPALLILPHGLPDKVAPGSQTPLTLQLYDQLKRVRVANTPVQIRLTSANGEVSDLFVGQSNAAGTVEFMLTLPTDLPMQPVKLDVYAQAAIGNAHLQRRLIVAPPVTITPLHVPKRIFAGRPVTYTLRIDDNLNHLPAADSDVQVYLSGGDYSWGTPIFDDQAAANGVVTFTLPAINNASAFYLDLRAQSFEGDASYNTSIEVIPTLAITLIGLAERITPGSSSEVQLRVWDNPSATPAHDAAVKIDLRDSEGTFQQQIEGVTDANGYFTFHLEPPAAIKNGWLNLNVTATTAEAAGTAAFGVAVQEDYQVLLTTDKPIYQPGQTLHIRLLALNSISNQPAVDQVAQLTVRDSRGTTLLERALTTSAYGVATADLPLDSEAPSGHYQLNVALGNSYNSHTVEIKPYTLPRFQITITDTQPYYAPGATAEGTVQAAYFFGKPVAAGQVIIRGYGPTKLNSKQEAQLLEVTGETDANGRYTYSLPLPTTFRGQLGNKTSTVRLEVTVIDSAEHQEQSDVKLLLAEQPLLVEAVPEAGQLKPGLANLVYVQVSHPDGNAAQTTLAVNVGNTSIWQSLTTDTFGLATLVITPTQQSILPLLVRYSDDTTQYQATIKLPVESQTTPAILLRPAQAEVPAGGELALDLWVAQSSATALAANAYVEVVKAGQVMQTIAVPLAAGHGHVVFPVAPHLVGTVLLNAHLLLAGNQRSSDARLVLVNPPPVDLAMTADAPVYHPGDTARLTIAATQHGQPRPGVLGVSIVDASVFALAEQTVGFARTFFLLDRELTQARYAIAGFAEFGDAQSPYDNYSGYNTARYPVIKPTLLEQQPKSAAILQQSRNTALLAWMAQDLQTPATTTTVMTPTPVGTGVPRRVGLFGLCLLIGGLYAGRRRLTPPVMAILVVGLSSLVWVACAPAGGTAPAPAAETAPEVQNGRAPRLRQFFPETLLWLPAQETDDQGRTTLAIPLADSITTWRVTVLFSDQAGNLGSSTTDLRVFQDFFVEPQLPTQLTQGDAIQVPVNLYNYLNQPQTVTIEVKPAAWFSSTKQLSTTVTLAANEVTVAYFPLHVTGVGEGLFEVNATSDHSSDGVQRTVQLVYNGEPQTRLTSDRLRGQATRLLAFPATTLTDTRQLTLKLFPSPLSQVTQNVTNLLSRPYGNTADVVSQNLINAALLTLWQSVDDPALTPLRNRAETLLSLGYQRIVAAESEREPGGFSLYDGGPARPWLSAYVLWHLSELGKLTTVDPRLIERIITYLSQQQLPDGSWPADEIRYYGSWRPRQARLATTAAIAWLSAESGLPNAQATAYLRQATSLEMDDPYVYALVLNALMTDGESQPQANALLQTMLEQQQSQQGQTYWQTTLTTFLGSAEESADLETTALMVYALRHSQDEAALGQSALDYLLSQQQADGTFATPQLTALILKALLLSVDPTAAPQQGAVTVKVANEREQQLTLDTRVVAQQAITRTALPPTSTLQLTVTGLPVVPYQLISAYILPWPQVVAAEPTQPFAISSTYDADVVALHEVVTLHTTITISAPNANDRNPGAYVATLNLPPGFTPLPADLAALRSQRLVSAYNSRPNQLELALDRLHAGQHYQFDLRLQATIPGTFQVAPAQFAQRYRTGHRSLGQPQQITVTMP